MTLTAATSVRIMGIFASALAVKAHTSATCPGRSFFNPSTEFDEYVPRYRCNNNNNCNALAELVGEDQFCNPAKSLCQANELTQTTNDYCASDSDCKGIGDDLRCSFYGACQSINFLLKYSSISSSKVIMPGETITVRFEVEDHVMATVPNTAQLDLVFYGGEPEQTVVTRGDNPQGAGQGLVMDQVSDEDLQNCAFPRRNDTRFGVGDFPDGTYNPLYWRVHYDYIPGVETDNAVVGIWEFEIRNEFLWKPMVFVGGFFPIEVRLD